MRPTETPTPGYWVHDLDPIAFRFPEGWPIHGVHWYGLSYAFAFLLAGWMMARWRRAGHTPLRDGLDDSTLMTALMVGVVVGGRLGHVLLYAREAFFADPTLLLRVWEGGMAFHGGLVGATLGALWFARSRHRSFLAVGDLVCALAPAGLLLGRLANFINAELIGRPTELAWAVIFPLPGGWWSPPSHPSQLYQAALEGLLLGLWMLRRYPQRLPTGQISAEFLMLYAIVRSLGELARLPEDGFILGFTAGQFWSLPMLLVGAGLWVYARRNPDQPSDR